MLKDVTYAVERHRVDWGDPGGAWQLAVLDDVSALLPMGTRLAVGGGAFFVLCMLGWLLLELLRSHARVNAALERFKVLGTALGVARHGYVNRAAVRKVVPGIEKSIRTRLGSGLAEAATKAV